MAYRRTEKTEARRIAQHKLLLDTALVIVAEGGFQSLTIASLAERAEVATGTVYKYFTSKAELCAEVFRVATEKEVRQVTLAAFPDESLDQGENKDTREDIRNTAQPPQENCQQRLYKALEIFSLRALAGRKLAYALIAEPVDSMVQEERLKYRCAYAEIFERLISEGSEKGDFAAQNARISAAALVGALAETLLGSIALAKVSSLDDRQDEWLQEIIDFCMSAIVRPASA